MRLEIDIRKGQPLELRDYQKPIADALLRDLKRGDEEVLLAACPGFGKTEVALHVIREMLKIGRKSKRALVLAHGQSVLRTNFQQRLMLRCPELADRVRVALPHEHRTIEGEYDLLVVDEAHDFYEVEGGMVDKIKKRVGVKQALLLTGSPSIFIRRGLKPHVFALADLHKVDGGKWVSDFRIDLVTSAYGIGADDWNSRGEVRESFRYTQRATNRTMNGLVRLVRGFGKNKTIIACQYETAAQRVAKYLRAHGYECLVSTQGEQDGGANVDAFKAGACNLLVVVRRGTLGFDMPELATFIDLTGSKNPDRIFQMACRVVRPSDAPKAFVKVMPRVFAEDKLRFYMTGVFQLATSEFIGQWDGSGFSAKRIPVMRNEAARAAVKTRRMARPVLSNKMMLFGDLFEAIEHGAASGAGASRIGWQRLASLTGRRDTTFVTINAKENSLSGWAAEAGLSQGTIFERYRRGLRGSALIAPLRQRGTLVTIDGRTNNLVGWSKESGISQTTINRRYKDGLRDGRLLSRPRRDAVITIDGITKTFVEWAKLAGISRNGLDARYAIGIRGRGLIARRRSSVSAVIDGHKRTLYEWAKKTGLDYHVVSKRFRRGVRGRDLLAPPRGRS